MNKHTNRETLPDEIGRQLTAHLLKQTGWVITHDLRAELGFSRRDCKLARVAAGAECVISTNAGYRATELATTAELEEAEEMFRAQMVAAYENKEGVGAVIKARKQDGKQELIDAIKSGKCDDWFAALKDAGVIV